MKRLLAVCLLCPVVWADGLSITSADRESGDRSTTPSDTVVVLLPAPPPAPEAAPSAPQESLAPTQAEPELPAEFRPESAFYLQQRIGAWTLLQARTVLGRPLHQRPSFGDQGKITGQIYAFPDPTKRYRQLELSFDQDSVLQAVFAYPWQLSWQECRQLWGTKVSAANAPKGRKFYSYADRHLDVLVDGSGRVISLGLY